MQLKEQAKAYIEALGLNSVNLDEIINWADSIILNEVDPQLTVIELASAKNKSEVVTALNKLAKEANELIAIQILFGILYKSLSSGASNYSEVAKRLYFWNSYESESTTFNGVSRFWDALDLEDREKVEIEMLKYLRDNSA